MRDLGTLGGLQSTAYAINDNGEVVGNADPSAAGRARAFRWQDGRMASLGALGGHYSIAVAVNDAGEVAGASDTHAHQTHAVIWSPSGQITDIGSPLTPGFSEALDVDQNGDVIVQSEVGSFLYHDGRFINLEKAVVQAGGYGPDTMNDRLQMAGGDCIGLRDYTILEPVAAFDDANTRVRYSGEWTHQLAGSSYAGTTTWSKTPGASATLRFRGRRVWWVAPFGRSRGSATVYLDGKAVAVVHLHHTATSLPRQTAFQHSFAAVGTRTITVVVNGTPSGHPRVDVDAFTVSQL